MKFAILSAAALVTCAPALAQAQHPMILVNGVRNAKCEAAMTGGSAFPITDSKRDAIESIEVVKGPAAVAQYGAAATDGVISITLKKNVTTVGDFCATVVKVDVPAIESGKVVLDAKGDRLTRTPPPSDAVAKYMYTPELVMAHQDAIGLTRPQAMEIKTAAELAQLKILDTQYKLAGYAEKLSQLLSGPTVDEAAALAQIDQTLALEREVKRAQLAMLVEVKNHLTPAQQAALDKLK